MAGKGKVDINIRYLNSLTAFCLIS